MAEESIDVSETMQGLKDRNNMTGTMDFRKMMGTETSNNTHTISDIDISKFEDDRLEVNSRA